MHMQELELIVQQVLSHAKLNVAPGPIAEMLVAGTQQYALSDYLARSDNPNLQLQDDRTQYNRAAIDLLLAYYRLELPPSLQNLLQMELDAGNAVREVSKGWPKENSIFIKFARAVNSDTPDWLEHREINSPHWWKAEIYDPRTGHLFAW